MLVEIDRKQRKIILKLIGNIKRVYDFDNTNELEFKSIYEISKRKLIDQTEIIKEVLAI